VVPRIGRLQCPTQIGGRITLGAAGDHRITEDQIDFSRCAVFSVSNSFSMSM
jgi:hypothetical protein